jgi:hypothetical protein
MPSTKGRMPLKPTRRAHRNDHGALVKECVKCSLVLPIDVFQKNSALRTFDGYAPYCRSCRSEDRRRRYEKPEHREQLNRATESGRLRRLYGLTLEDVEAHKQRRAFRCDICGQTKSGKHLQALHVDHCHETGQVRGMLCNHCNRGLGLFFDDPARLREAAAYLERACKKQAA